MRLANYSTKIFVIIISIAFLSLLQPAYAEETEPVEEPVETVESTPEVSESVETILEPVIDTEESQPTEPAEEPESTPTEETAEVEEETKPIEEPIEIEEVVEEIDESVEEEVVEEEEPEEEIIEEPEPEEVLEETEEEPEIKEIAEASYSLETEEENTTTTPDVVVPEAYISIQYEGNWLFNESIPLPTSTLFNYHESTTTTLFSTSTESSSVFTLLLSVDEQSEEFEVSDIVYYPSFSSFYVKCLNITTSTEACDSWQYAIDENYGQIGMDQQVVNEGEHVYIYFGDSWKVTANTTTPIIGTTTTFHTWQYQYDDLEEPWTNDPLTMIDISIDNPSSTGWWDTTISLDTLTSDEQGLADYVFSSTGTFYAKITSLDWTKYSDTIEISVVGEPEEEEEEQEEDGGGNNGGGGGGSQPETHEQLNVQKAIDFLLSQQNDDGSFGSAQLYTDWTAIALGAGNEDNDNLKDYLLTDPNPGIEITDYERRAMALMSLNIDPFSGTATDYVKKITDSFDGEQFGEASLINDDIFAIVTLVNAGYGSNDDMIVKSVQYILDNQQSNGSWMGVDLTSAAIQALKLVTNLASVSEAITKARKYVEENQENDGGFGNSFATSWSIQSISALGENQEDWEKNNNTPGDYLYSEQADDGGLEEGSTDDNRIWSTAYAISAALGKTWDSIMHNFSAPVENPTENNPSGGGGQGQTNPVQDSPTTTPEITTTTPIVVPTSTLELDTTTSTLAEPEIIVEEPKILENTEVVVEETTQTIPPQPSVVVARVVPTEPKIVETEEEEVVIPPVDSPVPEQTLSANTSSIPLQNTAKGVFGTSVTLASGLGLFLAWRFLQTVV